ncbi:MAG: DUF2752 domain-containing protein [Clostridia bacterium]|nr:DUF2752 domain-containing protein [Clostridia bacterium]
MTKKIFCGLFLAAYFAAAYALFNYFGISCVYLELTGIPCPGCGMTRALFAVLRGDLAAAIKHNALIFFMPYVFAYILFDFKHRAHKIVLALIGIASIINWAVKLILFF